MVLVVDVELPPDGVTEMMAGSGGADGIAVDWDRTSVVTPPVGVILRITALPVSATYTLPASSRLRLCGWLNQAL